MIVADAWVTLFVVAVCVVVLLFVGLVAYYWREITTMTILEVGFFALLWHFVPVVGALLTWAYLHERRRQRL